MEKEINYREIFYKERSDESYHELQRYACHPIMIDVLTPVRNFCKETAEATESPDGKSLREQFNENPYSLELYLKRKEICQKIDVLFSEVKNTSEFIEAKEKFEIEFIRATERSNAEKLRIDNEIDATLETQYISWYEDKKKFIENHIRLAKNEEIKIQFQNLYNNYFDGSLFNDTLECIKYEGRAKTLAILEVAKSEHEVDLTNILDILYPRYQVIA